MKKNSAEPVPRRSAADPHIAAPAPRRRHRTGLIIAIIVLALLGVVWWVNHREASAAGPGGPPGAQRGRGGRGGFGGGNAPQPVDVRTVGTGDIHVYLNALGTVVAAHNATIRSQISGQLQQVLFQEGQLVHEGDPLAVIDPRPFENALAQASAQRQQAQSQLAIARADLERYEKLAQLDSIAKQQVDTTRSQVSQAEGAVKVAEAAVATANLNLTYCHIKAPFTGRVGLRQVDPGNYVTPGDANGLVVLAQTKPITVIFTLPEDNMPGIAAQLHGGARLPVDAYDRTQTKKLESGTLLTIDNQIDPTTGTFKLRAEFANEDETLFPNQFVNVKLLVNTLHDAVVIPASAVERGQKGTFVYLVTPEETATARDVTLGPNEGEMIAIESGLKVGDRIVTDGADRLKEGQKVILPGERAGPAAEERKGPGAGKREGGGGPGSKKGDGQRKKAGAESEKRGP